MPVEVGPVVVGDDRVAEQRARRIGGRLEVDELEVGQAVPGPPRGDRLGAAGVAPLPLGLRTSARNSHRLPSAPTSASSGQNQCSSSVSTHDPIQDVPDPAGRRQQLEAVAGLDEGGVVGEEVVAQLVVGAEEGVLEQPQRPPVRQGVGVRVVGAGEPGGVVGPEEVVEVGRGRRGGARRRPRQAARRCDHDVAEYRDGDDDAPARTRQHCARPARPRPPGSRAHRSAGGRKSRAPALESRQHSGGSCLVGRGPGSLAAPCPLVHPPSSCGAARRDAIVAEGRLRYPETLPITARRDELLAAIRDHQVVIVAGETGSGKSTQLPKLCLELGRGVDGLIGHTQPRRVAARTIAERVADELGSAIGDDVGYTVRFNDRVGDGTLVRVMTDGILLAEIQRDRMLRRYDTLIIDEAHERSLNIDFILGYLRQLLPRRPDLKVIVTSATIDTERFARHFALDGEPAPIVKVTGRTYPVEVRYRPFGDEPDDDRDQVQAIVDAVDELAARAATCSCSSAASGRSTTRPTPCAGGPPRDTEVLPLYARLSSAEQHRIFQPHAGRRIVLATNVAETSLTVPGVRYVVDAGTARISRYSRRLKVQRLPIEPVSQASADQRAGRCGRVAAGICIRLYAEDDFAARARVHRAGDPAHQPRVGHPADDRDRSRRRRRVPVRRAARRARRSATATSCSRSSARSARPTTTGRAG